MNCVNVCSIFGHRTINNSCELEKIVEKSLTDLIETGVDWFLFGSNSEFYLLCGKIIEYLKDKYPKIRMIAYCCKDEKVFLTRHKKLFEQVIPDNKNDSNDIFFDDMIKDEKFWGRASFVKRNQKMIDNSDCCLFYYDKSYQVGTNKKSGTKIAFDYATKRIKEL